MFRHPVCLCRRLLRRLPSMAAPACSLMVCAAFLGACGASLDNAGMQNALVPDEQKAGAIGAADSATGSKSEAKVDPAKLAQAADAFAAAGTPGNTSYKIGPQDVLDISVFKVAELSRSVQVADVGTINLPLVGEVQAVGRTAQELEQDLAKKLGAKYLQSPQVTVYVKEYNSRRVTIDGAVKKPGVYPIRGKTSLLQFIAMAEGPTDASDTSAIVVFRRTSGKRSAAKFDLDQIRSGAAEDPVIQEGDVIVVNESATKAAFQGFLKALPITSAFVPLL